MILKIILPAASPVIFAGLRLGCAAGFIGVILAELLITPTGIGDLITYNQSIAEYPEDVRGDLLDHRVLGAVHRAARAGRGRAVPAGEARSAMSASRRSPRSSRAVAAADPVVEVRGVSKIYAGGVEALNDITLDFPRGPAHLAARAVRLRQDHAAEDHRRPDAGDLRRGPGRTAGR